MSTAGTFATVKLAVTRTWPFLAAAAFGMGSFYLVQALVIQRVASAQTPASPFVLVREGYDFDGDPAGRLTLRQTEGLRSDGATVLAEDIMPDSPGGHSARRVTLPDGTVVTLIDALGIKSTWPRLSAEQLAQRKSFLLHPPENCIKPGETLVGFEALDGRHAAVVKEPLTGNTQVTAWRDSTLGCATLQLNDERVQPDGTRKLVAQSRLVSLSLDEPDPALFDTGAGYTEMKPSERLRKQTEHDGVAWDENLERQGERLDKAYYGTDRP
jgi:hypothetical protein